MSMALLKALLYKKALDRKQRLSVNTETKGSEVLPNLFTDRDVAFGSEEKICRICCEGGDIPIFSELFDKTVADYINLCSEITVSSSDGYPKWLCGSCYELLKNCIKFREMSRWSTAKLIKIKMEKTGTRVPPAEPVHIHVKCEDDRSDDDGCPASPARHASSSPIGAGEGRRETQREGEGWTEGRWEDDVIPNCETCGEDFIDIIEYRNHLSTCNQSLPGGGDAKSLHTIFMNRKKRKKTPKGPFLCEICGKSLGKLHSLAVHRTTHRNVFPFKCDQCPYRGRTKDLLKVHMRTHLAVRPFACAKCPLRFTTASNLSKHRARHEEQKPQECPQCGKTFTSKLSVARHITDIHIGTPPVHCDICGKRFTRQKNLHKHRLKAHNIKAERTGRWPSYLLCHPEDPGDTCEASLSPQGGTLDEQ